MSVTVDAEHVDSLDEVVDQLRAHGLEVERVMPGLGMVSGRAGDVDALRRVTGVVSVDTELVHRLPPPGDDVQ